MIDVKIDRTTLPKDYQFIKFTTHGEEEHAGQFIEGDDLFLIHPSRWFQSWSVHAWEPLKIEWEIDYFTEPKERLAALKGFDEFGNEYEAGGQISTIDDEILKVEDIEKIHKPIKRPEVAKNIVWRKS